MTVTAQSHSHVALVPVQKNNASFTEPGNYQAETEQGCGWAVTERISSPASTMLGAGTQISDNHGRVDMVALRSWLLS
jgi:hypothetical protein